MKIGYARVSTQDQDTALQLDALNGAGCSLIYQEKKSGASRRGRVELEKCLNSLKSGDVLVIYKIDRIARSLLDLLAILRQLEQVGASIKSITEPIDTTNSMGVFMIQILGAVAQLERSMIRERSIAGQVAARERGRLPGRARALTLEQEKSLISDYQSGHFSYSTLAKKYDVSPSAAKRAVYRVTKSADYIKRHKV